MQFNLANDEELDLSAWRSLGVCERSAWSASRPVALWRFPALRYCVGHNSWAFGDHWVSCSLKGAMRAPLHVLVVLLCSAYMKFRWVSSTSVQDLALYSFDKISIFSC